MPDAWLRWGTDGDGDRIADPWDGRRTVSTPPPGTSQRRAAPLTWSRSIFAYNHANWYVDDVLELAALFGQGAGETTLVYDGLRRTCARPSARSFRRAKR